MSSQNFRNSFGLIRLIAAIQVLLVHGFNHFGLEHGFIDAIKIFPGVPIFFFVSGLMIYGSFERNRHKGFFPFYKNRFLRIYPGLWACVTIATVSVYLSGYWSDSLPSVGALTGWLLAQASIVQFYNPEFMRAYGVGVLNGALWTISVELQFYIIVPLLYYVLIRSRKIFIFGIVISIMAHIIVHHMLPAEAIVTKFLRITFIPWVFIFATGVLVAHLKALKQWILEIPFWIPAIAFVLSMLFIGDYKTNAANSINPVSVLLLCILVLQLGYWDRATDAWINKFASRTDLSYGMYLYHMPIINYLLFMNLFDSMVNVAITFIASIFMALLSWFFIEKPSLSHKS